MASSAPLYCAECGAANQRQDTHCFACGRVLASLVTIGGSFLFSQFNQRPLPMTGPLPLPSILLTYRGHRGGVYSVAWANGGKRIASASDDGTVQIWDASTGRRLLTHRGHVSWVWDAA